HESGNRRCPNELAPEVTRHQKVVQRARSGSTPAASTIYLVLRQYVVVFTIGRRQNVSKPVRGFGLDSKIEMLAQEMNQQRPRLDGPGSPPAVNRDCDCRHASSSDESANSLAKRLRRHKHQIVRLVSGNRGRSIDTELQVALAPNDRDAFGFEAGGLHVIGK